MRERFFFGSALMLLLAGCSSSQPAAPYPYGPMPATPGVTGNVPPVGPAHPMSMVPPSGAPGAAAAPYTANRPPYVTPPGSRVGGPSAGRPPFSPALPATGYAPPPAIDPQLLAATYATTQPGGGQLTPVGGTAAPERSDLMYATTGPTTPPTPKEPAPMKEPAQVKDLPPIQEPPPAKEQPRELPPLKDKDKEEPAVAKEAKEPPAATELPPLGTPSTVIENAPGVAVIMRTVNTTKFNLTFELKDSTPGATVEVWATKDQKVWKHIPATLVPPNVVAVEVPAEGTYGLMLLVKTAAVPVRTPKPGDMPHIWVAVDTAKPAIELLGVDLSLSSQKPALVVRWKATDRNFGPRPMTISYAESAEGPWIPLAAGVANTGRHEFPLAANLPRRMHIRVEGCDLAGNQGAAHPLKIDLPGGTETTALRPTTPPPSQPARPAGPPPTISGIDLAPGGN